MERRTDNRVSIWISRAGVLALLGATSISTTARADASNPPKDASADINFLGKSTDTYVGLLSNYYQVLDGLVTFADWAYNAENGTPSIGDLLEQIKTEIITELKSERDDSLTWAAESYADRFEDIVKNPQVSTNVPPSQTVEDLLTDAGVTLTSMKNIIVGDSLDQAYRIAPHYDALVAVYAAMLKYEGYSTDTINAHLETALETDYLLVGARDAGCSIASGIDTSFTSKIFAYKYQYSTYSCSRIWDCSLYSPNYQYYSGSFGCDQGPGAYATYCYVGEPTWCSTPSGAQAQCETETRAHALWQLDSDVVATIVRADIDRTLQRLGGWQVSDPAACSGSDLSLFSWSELCDVNCAANNLARNPSAMASQSSVALDADASRAVDGNTDGAFSDGSVTHTNREEGWWQVDLGFLAPIGRVQIWNRSDCCSDRLNDFWIMFSYDGVSWDASDQPIHVTSQVGFPSEYAVSNTYARYVRIQFVDHSDYLSLAEVKVFAPGQ